MSFDPQGGMPMKKTLLLGVALAAHRPFRTRVGRTQVQAGRRCQIQLGEFRGPQEGRPQGRDAFDLRAVARRGRGAGPLGARLFHRGDRRDDQLFVVGKLRAADRHRYAGRQPAQHRHPAAARPSPGSRLEGTARSARRRRRHLRQGQLRRGPVLGRPRHLQGQGRRRKVLRIPLQGRPEVAGLVRAGEFRGSRL